MTEAHDNDSSGLAPSDDLDDAVAARLARLAARRSPSAPSSSTAASVAAARPAYASTTTRPARPKRRHAAAGARQAALVLSLATTGGLSYAMSLASTSPSTVAQTAGVVSTGLAPASTIDATASSNTTTADAVTVDTTTAAAATTSDPIVVNGDTFSNKFGNVQVQASFAADGTITSVTTLQTPDGDNKSVRINDQAVPTLNAEALSIQTADVDTVSGATYTSNDYRSSLQSAIDTARASGLVTTR